jgi:site-specific recombinase XerD
MKTTITILFYLKRAKVNPQGLIPIFQRITINGKRIDTSTGKYINPTKWSVEGVKMKGSSEEARTVNSYLDALKSKVADIEKQLLLKEEQITFETFKNKWQGKEERKRTIIPIFKEHNSKIEKLLNQEYAPLTLKRYNTALSHLQNFLVWKYSISDIEIDKINHAFIADLDFYLRSERKCNNNTTIKYIKNIGKIVRECIANGWLTVDPFLNYKAKMKEVSREYLSEEEIESLLNKSFTTERLEIVRDIFIFSCYTGLAYIDAKNLNLSNISIGIDGEKWIFTTRQKTDVASRIPLLPVAEIILEKYKDHPYCLNKDVLLPIMSNQKMNSYLKEIADFCSIKKQLTYHIARHTFATTVTLTNGVPIESVSKMLGHTNIKTTQHYAKILDRKVSEDMMSLRTKLSQKEAEKNREIS